MISMEVQDQTAARQARLQEALSEYLRAAAAGERVDQEQFVARHPGLEPELRAFFAAQSTLFLQGETPAGSGASARAWHVPCDRLLRHAERVP